MSYTYIAQLIVAGIMLGWASIEDIRTFTIPLYVMVFGGILGFVTWVVSYSVHGSIESGIGGLVGGGLAWILRRVSKLGEADVLLYLALGFILGPTYSILIFVLSNVFVLIRVAIPVIRKQKVRIAMAPYITAGTTIAVIMGTLIR